MKRKVENRIHELIALACEFEDLDIPGITFDIRGMCAGMCRIEHGEFTLRFNLKLLRENEEDFLKFTVPHEVAHYVTRKLFGSVSPHGKEWKLIMNYFGIEKPLRYHNFNVSSTYPWKYECNCQTHYLSDGRHTHAKRGRRYICDRCKTYLKFVGRNSYA